MKEGIKIALGMVSVFVLSSVIVSCASIQNEAMPAEETPATTEAAPANETGFLDGYYKLLQPGPRDGVKERWLKPGVDYAKFSKVMIDSVVFYFDENSEDKGIDPDVMKRLADTFHKDLVDALKDTYPLVAEPGTGVVRYKIALTGIKQSRPVLSGVTTVIPVGLAASTVKKGVAGSWAGSGATSMELLAIDTETGEVIAAARDEQSAGFTERFSKYGSADAAFRFWAERLRFMMDKLHGQSPE